MRKLLSVLLAWILITGSSIPAQTVFASDDSLIDSLGYEWGLTPNKDDVAGLRESKGKKIVKKKMVRKIKTVVKKKMEDKRNWSGSQTGRPDDKPMKWNNASGVRAAIEANDYAAFVVARNASKPSLPTQEQFNKRVEAYKLRKAVDAAIDANDFTGFSAAVANLKSSKLEQDPDDGQKLEDAPSYERFAKVVAKKKLSDALKLALKNSDYEAYKTALANLRAGDDSWDDDMKVPSQEEFTKMADRAKKLDAIHAALEANDYAAFTVARNANQPAVPSQEEFAKMVEKNKSGDDDKKDDDKKPKIMKIIRKKKAK